MAKLPKSEEVKFASTERIDEVNEIATELLERILKWNSGAWLSDESRLTDFPSDEIYESNQAMLEKIKFVFGVDVTDISDTNIVRIAERIQIHRRSH